MKKWLTLRVALLLIGEVIFPHALLANNTSDIKSDIKQVAEPEQANTEGIIQSELTLVEGKLKSESISEELNTWNSSEQENEALWSSIEYPTSPPSTEDIAPWDTIEFVPPVLEETEILWGNHSDLDLSLLDSTDINPSDSLPRLFITEFFFKGYNDYLEIYNDGDNFQGTIELILTNKKKLTSQLLQDISLPAKSSIVLAKKKDIFTNIETESLNLTLSKPEDMELKLRVDGISIDTFSPTKAEINTILEENTSLERIRKNWLYKIVPTPLSRTINLQPGFQGNPGLAFEQVDTLESSPTPPEDDNDTENTIIGNKTLILTEVFFHKSNSWVEITNLDTNTYEWSIRLKGIHKTKELTYNVKIPGKGSLIIAQNTKFLDEGLLVKDTNDKFFIDRKKTLHISLIDQNNQEDIFLVHQDWVRKKANTEPNAGNSFEKVMMNGNWITSRTSPERRKNIRGSFDANPGMYYDSQNFSQELENIKDVTQAIKNNEENSSEWSNQLCHNFSDKYRIEIQEVFGWNESYPAFIEIKLTDDPKNYQQLRFRGDILTEEFEIETEDAFWEKGESFLITNTSQHGFDIIDSYVHQQFSFWNSSWNLILEWRDGQWRQVLDIIIVKDIKTGLSLYDSWNKKEWCFRLFDEYGDFSPWFDKKFLEFFKIDSNPKIEYVYIGWGWGWSSCNCPTKADFCPINKPQKPLSPVENINDMDNLSGSSTTLTDTRSLSWNYQVKIEDISYDPPGSDKNKESITLILTEGSSLNLKYTTLLINGKHKKKLSGELVEWASQTLYGNFWFPNSSKENQTVSIQLLLWEDILDTYYYTFPPKSSWEKKITTPPQEGYKVFSVLDGDTFRYRDEEWKLQSVRLLWVDSPESNTTRYKKIECYGKEAKEYLTSLIKGKYVKLVFDSWQSSTDHYGRYLAYVYLDDLLINEHMIKSWFAREYTYKIPYSLQEKFKTAEKEAQQHQSGMWNPQYCPDNLIQEQTLQEHMTNLIIKITHIDYNPEWKDSWNERIELSVYDKSKLLNTLDFSNQFWIFVFDSHSWDHVDISDFMYEKGKFIDLSFLWEQKLDTKMILQGDFKLPNTKSSCIALVQREHLFDIACYNSWDKSPEVQSNTSQNTQLTWKIKILSILPNPLGKDHNKEEIELIYEGEESQIDLNNFYLLINGKNKKKLSWELTQSKIERLQWNFWFPNTYACVSLHLQDQILDTFCYNKEKEWTKIWIHSNTLSTLSLETIGILKQIKIKRYAEEFCVEYEGTKLDCRKSPKYKIDPKIWLRAIVFNNALSTLETLLREKYSPLYYQTEIVDFFALLTKTKSALKAWETSLIIANKEYVIKDFSKLYGAYTSPFWIQGLWILESFLSPDIKTTFLKKQEQWIKAHSKAKK